MSTAKHDAMLRKALLERRLQRFAENSRYGAIPSLVAIILLMIVFGRHASLTVQLGWLLAFGTLVTIRVILGRKRFGQSGETEELERRFRVTERTLMAGAVIWGCSLPLAAALGGRQEIAALAALGSTVFAGVLLMHRNLPVAARFHILVVGLGLGVGAYLIVGLASWPILCLIGINAIAMYMAVGAFERHFVAACEADVTRQEAEATIRMLLNDYEAQAADWLWTIDEAGRFENVSEPLAAAFDIAADELEGSEFLPLLDPGRFRDAMAITLSRRAGFRDQRVSVTTGDGSARLLSLSGHPMEKGRIGGVGRDITLQKDLEDRVRAMAFVDPLTGLANRHFFNQRLSESVEPGTDEGRSSVFFSLDLDAFRNINDSLGHTIGDSVLREIAHRLCVTSRTGDLIARVGGDEFMVLSESAGGDGLLLERAHRMLAAIREPIHVADHTLQITACVGIGRCLSGIDPGEALRRVELALHAAKAKGRDTVALYDDALDRRARERRALEVDLRHAIERDQLVLHYQPVVALPGGETLGYEALLRWNHPARGLLLPEHFIGIAEESGLIAPLGDWMIARALEEVAPWPGDFRVALNLSPSQVRNPRLIATVEAALAATQVPASRIEFEITEQVLMADVKAGRLMLERLRGLGAEIALDDFGTGYASLSYLREFRFERVKIDRSFVTDLDRTDEARAIVSAVTRLAQALGMRTTAEGIETREQLDMVRKLGCDEAQGFLIHAAIPAEEIGAARARGSGYPGAARDGFGAIVALRARPDRSPKSAS